MKIFVLCILLLTSTVLLFAESPVTYVDPFVGTAGDFGQLDPAATLPFGKIKLGPDTEPLNHSGYNYDAEKIIGFSHNRLPGVGCSGAGGFVRMKPGVGMLSAKAEKYIKENEKATVGYYAVTFENKIAVELTVSEHVGWHRYTFPKQGQAWIAIDAKSTFADFLDSDIKVVAGNNVVGFVEAKNNCNFGRVKNYFSVHVDKKIDKVKIKNDVTYLVFNVKAGEQVEVQTALSPISIEQARADRIVDCHKKDFDSVRKNAKAEWNTLLSRVIVEGEEEYKKIFYTHLYHSYLMPVKTASTGGVYQGTDGKLYRADGFDHFASWSIWDTFRTKLPLVALLEPGVMRDICLSLVDLYGTGKEDSCTDFEPTPGCRTEHAIVVLLDAYQKGVEFPLEEVYPLMVQESEIYPFDSPDKKLESAYDFWALSEFARILGEDADFKKFSRKAMDYKSIWKEKFMVMDDKSDIMHGDGLYEGTLWQYRWFVPHDIPGIIDLIGGEKKFTSDLSYFFQHDLYNHGNQPDIHAPFLFNFGNSPWLTQKWVNAILTKELPNHYGTHKKWKEPYIGRIYKATPDAYIPEMDDDAGTMSAWYVFASIGLYPYCPGKADYTINSPIFDTVKINLENGNTFEIQCENLSDENFYIQSAELNGAPLAGFTLSHEKILKGGVLKYVMGPTPAAVTK